MAKIIKKTKVITRKNSGEVVENIKEEVTECPEHRILCKKTNYSNSISLQKEELDDISNGIYMLVRITVKDTEEVIEVKPALIYRNATRIPILDEETRRLKCWSGYYVAKFR